MLIPSQNIGFRMSSHLTVNFARICSVSFLNGVQHTEKLHFHVSLFNRKKFSTKVRTLSDIDVHVKEKIEAEEMKPRKHPGAFKLPPVRLPDKVIEAVKKLVTDVPVKNLLADSVLFSRYMHGRHIPVEENEILEKKNQFTVEVKEKLGLQEDKITEEQKNHYEKLVKGQVTSMLKQRVYNWTRVTYTEHNCLLYLFSRAPPEYAVLYRIFREIALRSPDFKPKSLFDFGSGVGTVTWAAQECWKTSLKEYFNVDACREMSDLARQIICDEHPDKIESRGMFYRQFLPSQHVKYDLVVSAFSLFDLPSATTRLDTVLNLWEKTAEFLVIVEQGTNAGFKLVLEARDFLLSKYGSEDNSKAKLHVFAPCPHDLSCPRFTSDSTPCNFELRYVVMPVGQKEHTRIERFSYVVLKKGKRECNTAEWPRVVRPVIKRSKLAICKLCTAAGKLQEVNFTESKHGRIPYRCARGSKWGDLLPMKLKDVIVDVK